MERVGVHDYEAEPFLEQSLKCKHVLIEGVYTHFANSEDPELTHARQQLERFQEALRFYEKRSLPVPIRHMAKLRGNLAVSGKPYGHGAPGCDALWNLSGRPGKDGRCGSCPTLEIAGGIFKGHFAGPPGQLWLTLAE